jgi:hypothetical protein
MIVIVALVPSGVFMASTVMVVIVTTRRMILRGKQLGRFLDGVLSADGAHMVGPAVQAFHVSQSIDATENVARRGPLDANFFTALGTIGGGREQRFGFAHVGRGVSRGVFGESARFGEVSEIYRYLTG